jgi:hypothetical protein
MLDLQQEGSGRASSLTLMLAQIYLNLLDQVEYVL